MTAKAKITFRTDVQVEEAYRVLRTNIQFCGIEKKIKTVAVTSCNPGEGKTTTALNLARSFAASGMKVLLVDTDLRKPTIMRSLKNNKSVGLTNIVSGQATFEDALSDTETTNLHYIGSGTKPPNPAELIGSKKFGEFVQHAGEEFDLVVFDTPPLGSVIDCALVSTQVDGTIIVIQAKSVEYKVVQKVKEQLERVNANILGVVLNKVDSSQCKGYYNYYNYYARRNLLETEDNKIEKSSHGKRVLK